jgi:hypothetical protein
MRACPCAKGSLLARRRLGAPAPFAPSHTTLLLFVSAHYVGHAQPPESSSKLHAMRASSAAAGRAAHQPAWPAEPGTVVTFLK